MSRVVVDLSWELVTSEGVVHVRSDRAAGRERWGLEEPAASWPGGDEQLDDELIEVDLL